MYWIALIFAALAAVCAVIFAMWQAEELRDLGRQLATAEREVGRLKRLYGWMRVLGLASKEERRVFGSFNIADLLASDKASTVEAFVRNLEKQVREDLSALFLLYADRFQTGEHFRNFAKEPGNEELFLQCIATAEQILKPR